MTHAHAIHKHHSWLDDLGHVLQRVVHTTTDQPKPRWGSYLVRYL